MFFIVRVVDCQIDSQRVSEVLRKLFADFFGSHGWGESGDDCAFTIHKELLKVPRNVRSAVCLGLLTGEPLVQIASTFAIDFDLRKEREVDVVVGCGELENLGIRARLLSGELITRETENGETLGSVCFLQRTQTCVLWGEASTTSDVDDQANLAAVRRKFDWFTRY